MEKDFYSRIYVIFMGPVSLAQAIEPPVPIPVDGSMVEDEPMVPYAPELGSAEDILSRTPAENEQIVHSLSNEEQQKLTDDMAGTAEAAVAEAGSMRAMQAFATVSRRRLADQLMFNGKPYPGFITYRAANWNKRTDLRWATDGCSDPEWVRIVSGAYRTYFHDPCVRHDFGYRNYGSKYPGSPSFSPTKATKDKIDRVFFGDTSYYCGMTFKGNTSALNSCSLGATAFYSAVSNKGGPAFFK